MGLLDHLEQLPGTEIIGRWGIGSVTEAYETGVGPYRIVLLRNERLKAWSAYCRREGRSLPEHISIEAETKERAIEALKWKLEEVFQSKREEFLKELGFLQTIEDMFDPEVPPKSALERLADEPI